MVSVISSSIHWGSERSPGVHDTKISTTGPSVHIHGRVRLGSCQVNLEAKAFTAIQHHVPQITSWRFWQCNMAHYPIGNGNYLTGISDCAHRPVSAQQCIQVPYLLLVIAISTLGHRCDALGILIRQTRLLCSNHLWSNLDALDLEPISCVVGDGMQLAWGTWLGGQLRRPIHRSLWWTVYCGTLPWSPLL